MSGTKEIFIKAIEKNFLKIVAKILEKDEKRAQLTAETLRIAHAIAIEMKHKEIIEELSRYSDVMSKIQSKLIIKIIK